MLDCETLSQKLNTPFPQGAWLNDFDYIRLEEYLEDSNHEAVRNMLYLVIFARTVPVICSVITCMAWHLRSKDFCEVQHTSEELFQEALDTTLNNNHFCVDTFSQKLIRLHTLLNEYPNKVAFADLTREDEFGVVRPYPEYAQLLIRQTWDFLNCDNLVAN